MHQENSYPKMLSNPDYKRQLDEVVNRSNKNNTPSCIFCGTIPEYDKIKSPCVAVGLKEGEILLVLDARAKMGKDIIKKDFKNKILIVSHDFDTSNIDPRFKIAKIHLETGSEPLKNQLLFIINNH